MPTYQYVCTACSTPLEVQQAFSDDPLTECPTCQGRLRKVFAAVGVVFKGSGFYRTDSRSAAAEAGTSSGPAKDAPSGDGASGSGGDGAKTSGGSGTSADTKAAGKSSDPKGSGSTSPSTGSGTSAA